MTLPTPAKPGHRPTTHTPRTRAELEWVGQTTTAEMLDTDGVRDTYRVRIFDAIALGCGCFRLYVDRPGPWTATDVTRPQVHLITGCTVHLSHLADL